jgi:CheY-like chemotaxis protein
MILLIDDDPDVLDTLAHRVATTGDEQVAACETIEDALKVIEGANDITIIYLDIYLPRVDGADSVKLISDAIKDKVPKPMIVSMSGDSSIRLKQQAIANGARKFYPKRDLLVDDDTFRQSLYLEERRQPRDDHRDWKKGIERTISGIERTINKLQELVTFAPDSIATQVARLQGEQLSDAARIAEIRGKQEKLEDELDGLLGLSKFVKGFPGGMKALFIFWVCLTFAINRLGDNILDATGVTQGAASFMQKMFPEKK